MPDTTTNDENLFDDESTVKHHHSLRFRRFSVIFTHLITCTSVKDILACHVRKTAFVITHYDIIRRFLIIFYTYETIRLFLIFLLDATQKKCQPEDIWWHVLFLRDALGSNCEKRARRLSIYGIILVCNVSVWLHKIYYYCQTGYSCRVFLFMVNKPPKIDKYENIGDFLKKPHLILSKTTKPPIRYILNTNLIQNFYDKARGKGELVRSTNQQTTTNNYNNGQYYRRTADWQHPLTTLYLARRHEWRSGPRDRFLRRAYYGEPFKAKYKLLDMVVDMEHPPHYTFDYWHQIFHVCLFSTITLGILSLGQFIFTYILFIYQVDYNKMNNVVVVANEQQMDLFWRLFTQARPHLLLIGSIETFLLSVDFYLSFVFGVVSQINMYWDITRWRQTLMQRIDELIYIHRHENHETKFGLSEDDLGVAVRSVFNDLYNYFHYIRDCDNVSRICNFVAVAILGANLLYMCFVIKWSIIPILDPMTIYFVASLIVCSTIFQIVMCSTVAMINNEVSVIIIIIIIIVITILLCKVNRYSN